MSTYDGHIDDCLATAKSRLMDALREMKPSGRDTAKIDRAAELIEEVQRNRRTHGE